MNVRILPGDIGLGITGVKNVGTRCLRIFLNVVNVTPWHVEGVGIIACDVRRYLPKLGSCYHIVFK